MGCRVQVLLQHDLTQLPGSLRLSQREYHSLTEVLTPEAVDPAALKGASPLACAAIICRIGQLSSSPGISRA